MTNTVKQTQAEKVMPIIREWAQDVVRVERVLRQTAQTIEDNNMDKDIAQAHIKSKVDALIPEHARGVERVLHQHKRLFVQALQSKTIEPTFKNTTASYVDFVATIIRNQATPYANHFKQKMERVTITPHLTRTLLTTKYIVRCNGILMADAKKTA